MGLCHLTDVFCQTEAGSACLQSCQCRQVCVNPTKSCKGVITFAHLLVQSKSGVHLVLGCHCWTNLYQSINVYQRSKPSKVSMTKTRKPKLYHCWIDMRQPDRPAMAADSCACTHLAWIQRCPCECAIKVVGQMWVAQNTLLVF